MEQAEGTKTIDAPASDIMEVLVDFESYPDWTDVKATKVVNTDAEGKATEVWYEVSQFGITAKYTLAYDYADDDGGMTWTTKSVEEGPIKDIQGEYVLEELDEDETKVTYKLEAEVDVPLPGFMKRQGAKQIVNQALSGLKKRVESR